MEPEESVSGRSVGGLPRAVLAASEGMDVVVRLKLKVASAIPDARNGGRPPANVRKSGVPTMLQMTGRPTNPGSALASGPISRVASFRGLLAPQNAAGRLGFSVQFQ